MVSPEYTKDMRIRIAVLDFDFKAKPDVASLFYGAGTLTNAGSMTADLLTQELMGIPGITVVERSRLKAILDEKNLSVSGLLESKELEKIAVLAGIDAFITGSVGDASGANVLGIFQGSTVAFQARCIKASNGIVLWSGSVAKEVGSANIAFNLHAAVQEFADQLRAKLSFTHR